MARDDLADVIAAVVTAGNPHLGRTYDITGPESLTLDEMGITYLNESLEQARQSRLSYGAQQWQLDAWINTYVQIANGELDVISDAVRRLTGHQPMSLREFLSTHPESYEQLLGR